MKQIKYKICFRSGCSSYTVPIECSGLGFHGKVPTFSNVEKRSTCKTDLWNSERHQSIKTLRMGIVLYQTNQQPQGRRSSSAESFSVFGGINLFCLVMCTSTCCSGIICHLCPHWSSEQCFGFSNSFCVAHFVQYNERSTLSSSIWNCVFDPGCCFNQENQLISQFWGSGYKFCEYFFAFILFKLRHLIRVLIEKWRLAANTFF